MKPLTVGIFVAGVLVFGSVAVLVRGGSPQTSTSVGNVSMENGKQIVVIGVRGGYTPQTSTVKSGVQTVLRFVTNGAYDCSTGIRIPSLGVSQNLPASGTTDIAVGSLPAGRTEGTCGMGMYRFTLNAE